MKHTDGRIRQLMSSEAAHQDTLIISARGLTRNEEAQIKALIRSIARKRSHEKRPRILYNVTFGN